MVKAAEELESASQALADEARLPDFHIRTRPQPQLKA